MFKSKQWEHFPCLFYSVFKVTDFSVFINPEPVQPSHVERSASVHLPYLLSCSGIPYLGSSALQGTSRPPGHSASCVYFNFGLMVSVLNVTPTWSVALVLQLLFIWTLPLIWSTHQGAKPLSRQQRVLFDGRDTKP